MCIAGPTTTSASSSAVTERGTAALLERVLALPRPLLLAFDVDGTLSPIVDDPAAATVSVELGRALRRLAKARGVRVALITGRDVAALSKMVRVPGAYRALEHGRVVLAPGQRAGGGGPSAPQRRALSAFEHWATVHALPSGAELERKAASRAVHVRRLARRDPKRAEALLAAAATEAQRLGLHPRPGRAVLEAQVALADKGSALRKLRSLTRSRGVLFIGDDLTDLPAIAAAVQLGGLGFFVRSPERPRTPSGASASLRNTDEVAELVIQLADALA